jgi:hypothetical protein
MEELLARVAQGLVAESGAAVTPRTRITDFGPIP